MTAPVRMYTTGWCPYCQRAERLLAAKGVHDLERIRVDLEPGLREAMVRETGRRTVPQIYIGTEHVGGFDDLAALDRAGKLDPMLKAAGAIAAPDSSSANDSDNNPNSSAKASP